jgi:hypothetical protein
VQSVGDGIEYPSRRVDAARRVIIDVSMGTLTKL